MIFFFGTTNLYFHWTQYTVTNYDYCLVHNIAECCHCYEFCLLIKTFTVPGRLQVAHWEDDLTVQQVHISRCSKVSVSSGRGCPLDGVPRWCPSRQAEICSLQRWEEAIRSLGSHEGTGTGKVTGPGAQTGAFPALWGSIHCTTRCRPTLVIPALPSLTLS